MPEGRFHESMDWRKAIKTDLHDDGLESPSHWKKVDEAVETIDGKYEKIFAVIDAKVNENDIRKREKFSKSEDSIERLKILRSMTLYGAYECIKMYASDPRVLHYLEKRLAYYNDLVVGRATKRLTRTKTDWDVNKGEFVSTEVVENVLIDKAGITPENVKTGLWREIAYAAMIGTPEIAIRKIAEKKCSDKKIKIVHLPHIKDGYSEIHEGNENIGTGYESLRKMYGEAQKLIERKAQRSGKILDPQKLEHKAVMLASEWLTEAMDYNPPGRSPRSSYVRSADEAVAWARLGSWKVKRQFRGMRQKIDNINLANIKRFVGRSGENKFKSQKKTLDGQVKFLQETTDSKERGEFTSAENEVALAVQQRTYVAAVEKQEKKLEKDKKQIEKADIPEEEKMLQLQAATEKFERAIALLEKENSERAEYFRHRTTEQLQTDLDVRKKNIDTLYQKNASLADKALFLHFKENEFNNDRNDSVIDWINSAPLGLVNWCYDALHRGASTETVFGYARALVLFPDTLVTRELIKRINQLTPYELQNIKLVRGLGEELKITLSLEDLCALAKYDFHNLRFSFNKGYTVKSLVEYPWLNDHALLEKSPFPFDGSKGKQQAWCVENAYYVPEGWQHKRLGNIILSRLNGGIDANIHDATFWLKELEVPQEKNGKVYKDHAQEISLIYSLTSVPEKLRNRVPTNPNKYADLFSSQATELVYTAMLPLVEQGELTYEQVRAAVEQELKTFELDPKRAKSLKTPLPIFAKEIEKCLEELKMMIQKGQDREPVPSIVGALKVVGELRNSFVDDAQTWVATHASAPRQLLALAWANRELALADGCADNPRAIKQWADLNGLRVAYDEMEHGGYLPHNFTREDLVTYKDWFSELVRCYDGNTAIKAIAELKESFNAKFYITPQKIDLGGGWVGEVFPKSDARGMTIGHDTGCCMTLGGVSNSCIKAGYANPSCGFFALYRDGQIVAQSFLYTNRKEAANTLVCDNIEANAGRDLNMVLKQYQEFFNRYLTDQLRRDPGAKLSKVHVGTGYTDIGLEGLKSVDSIPLPESGIYTDAYNQKGLLELSKEDVEKAKNMKVEIVGGSSWEQIKSQIMLIEEQAFEGRGYGEGHLRDEFSNPQNIALIMKDGDTIIGYCTAIAGAGDKEAVYVSSTALLSQYQGKGLVADLMYRLDIEAKRRGFKYYTRDARMDNGYADKLKKNYIIIKAGEPFKTIHGMQQHLKMEIPNHVVPKSLEQAKPVQHKAPEVRIRNLTRRNAGVIAELESAIYPEGMRQGEEFFADELDFEEGDESDNASFIVAEKVDGRSQPVGYTVAYITESEFAGGGSVLYVSDMALLPEQQRKGYGRKALERLLEFARARQGMPIEFHARASTSYAALIHSETMLEILGYRITQDQLMEGYFEDTDQGINEDVHLVRLERIDEMEEKMAA